MKLICIWIYVALFVGEVSSARVCQTPYDCPGAGPCHLFTHHWACVSSHHRHECHCHTGNKPITSLDSKYTLVIEEVTFARAEAMCKSMGQRLVKVNDATTFSYLKSFAFRNLHDAYLSFVFALNNVDVVACEKYRVFWRMGPCLDPFANPTREVVDGVWIGLKLDTSQKPGIVYRHVDGTQATYFMWETDSHEPNFIDHDTCVRLDVDHFLMRTTSCVTTHPFICEKVNSAPSPSTQGGERCVMKEDCAAHCKTTEYHCLEYACLCGTITFGNDRLFG